jgi:hypothetical protein
MSVSMKPGATALTVMFEQPALRRGVVGLADVAPLADDRRDVHDPAVVVLDHVRQRGLGHEEGAREVDREDLVPVLVVHLEHRLVDRDAGVVDEHVEPAVTVDDLGYDTPAILG